MTTTAVATCQLCHLGHPQCDSHNREGLPCGRRPMRGLTSCDRHYAQKARAAAGMPARDHLRELSKMAARAQALATSFETKVHQIDPEEMAGTPRDKQTHARWLLSSYERALDRAIKVTSLLVRSEMEDRRLALAERHVTQDSPAGPETAPNDTEAIRKAMIYDDLKALGLLEQMGITE